MKIKENLEELICAGKISTRSSEADVFEIEASDFDKAIQLLIKYNKKAGVKEYQMLKEAFVLGELNDYETKPNSFVRNLIETATKRTSSIEHRRIQSEIYAMYPTSEHYKFSDTIGKISEVFNSYNNQKHLANWYKLMLAITEQKVSALQEWMFKQGTEGKSIREMSADDFQEILVVLEEIAQANNEQEIEDGRYRQ
jgi:hypothetical protein